MFFKKEKAAETIEAGAAGSVVRVYDQYDVEVVYTEEEVDRRIRQLAEEISKDHAGHSVHLIAVLKGGAYFMNELARYMTVPVTMGYLSVAGYGSGSGSRSVIKITKDIDDDIAGRHVILVDDIIGTGYTHNYLMEFLKAKNPESLELCVLLSNMDRRRVEVDMTYCGFGIPNTYMVGCGLDSKQMFRNLRFIGKIKK